MTESTKGWLQYSLGGVVFLTSLVLVLPIVATRFDWPFVGRFGTRDTFVLWDVVTLDSQELNYYFLAAFMAGTGFIKLGFLLLSWGNRNLNRDVRRG